MMSGVDSAPFRAMDIEIDPLGELLYANPVDFDDWMKLPVRPGDDYVYTGRQHVRAPTVIISANYDRTPVKPVKLTGLNIKKRDNQICQYCNKVFPLDELNVDHVIPQYHGGTDSWTNLVCSCIDCNSKKGHKHNHEIGYKLLHEPKEPIPASIVSSFRCKHPSWAPFLPHKIA